MKTLFVAAALFLFFNSYSQATVSGQQDPTVNMSAEEKAQYYTLAPVEISELTNLPAHLVPNTETAEFSLDSFFNKGPLDQVSNNLDKIDLIVDKIINIGSKIWAVVEKGKAVQSFQENTASALPQNATRIEQLENWKNPSSKVVSVAYKNLLGMEVIRFTYKVVLLHGGTANGVGKYIGRASVEPLEMTTSYGFSFDAKAEVDAVFNKGTAQNPLAAMLLNVKWTVKAWNATSTVTHSYNLDGDGLLEAVGTN